MALTVAMEMIGAPSTTWGAGVLAQQTAALAFEPPQDVVMIWAQRAGLGVMVVSALLILYVLVKRRRRLMEAQSKWMLFVGLCVLPIPVAFLGSGVGMEESKDVEFCASCHAPMSPFVDDMMDPESETLAAVHYNNRLIQSEHCWNCHSDYGVAGTTRAKLSGLFDITQYTFNTWEAPIGLRKPYNWTICLTCHGSSQRFLAEELHEGIVKAAVAGETGCTECHEMAHPPRDMRGTK